MKKTRLAAMSVILLLAFNLNAQSNNSELVTINKSFNSTTCLIYNPDTGIIIKDADISIEADSLRFSDNQALTSMTT